MLSAVLVAVSLAGILVSFLIGRGIARAGRGDDRSAARRAELHQLADSFDAAVGQIVEQVGAAPSSVCSRRRPPAHWSRSRTTAATTAASCWVAALPLASAPKPPIPATSASQESVAAIKEIGGTIGRLAHISSTIAASMDEQGAATAEISRGVHQAAIGTNQVAASIVDVNRGVADTGTASTEVWTSAQMLSTENARLRRGDEVLGDRAGGLSRPAASRGGRPIPNQLWPDRFRRG